MNFNKWLKDKTTYNDLSFEKHIHDFSIKHTLVITNINEHASCNYFKRKNYYIVLKCSKCDSFIPDSVDGNFIHELLYEDINYELPFIFANTMEKCPIYSFKKLQDVVVDNTNIKKTS